MNLNEALQYVIAHITPFNVLLLVLLIASEVLGTNDNIKASSIYGVLRSLIFTLKDQVWPRSTAAPSVLPAGPTVPPSNPQ